MTQPSMSMNLHPHEGGFEVSQGFYSPEIAQRRPGEGWVNIFSGPMHVALHSQDAETLETLAYKLLDAAEKSRRHAAEADLARSIADREHSVKVLIADVEPMPF